MKKRWLIIMCILIVLIVLLGIILFANNKYNYISARNISQEYLNSHITKLEELGKDMLQEKKSDIKKYDNISYYYDVLDTSHELIYFEIKEENNISYGLIYSYLDNLLGYNVRDISYTNDSRGFYITEKLSDKWYFYYNDRDGITDISDIK